MREPDGALGAFAGRLWGIGTLAALAVGGLAGWFVIIALPILGLFVFGGLLFGWAWVKSGEWVAGWAGRALPAWSRGSRGRAGVAIREL